MPEPILTPDQMAIVDAAAPEGVDVLIERAGAAVARAALRLLGGAYGRRVAVVCGPGNNGNDGRVAARRLTERGVRCAVLAPGEPVPEVDLVIDAAYGTGFRLRPGWSPAIPSGVAVLAVDIPSGVAGLTGEAAPGVAAARHTVTFAALKPGLLLEPGRSLAGTVEIADIGLRWEDGFARAARVTAADVSGWLPARPVTAHKYHAACWIVAGSPGMTGAARLAASAAFRCGSGYVRLSAPGLEEVMGAPTEAVVSKVPEHGWGTKVANQTERFGALLVGPGLGLHAGMATDIRVAVANAALPVIVDGDGLTALGRGAVGVVRNRAMPTVLLPHDGEFRALTGVLPQVDRFEAARSLAAATRSVVLLKGACTIVAEPGGNVLVVTDGDARLATAGSGDVLAGVVTAFIARGMPAFEAAASAAYVHALAPRSLPRLGLVAGDLADRLPDVLVELAGHGGHWGHGGF